MRGGGTDGPTWLVGRAYRSGELVGPSSVGRPLIDRPIGRPGRSGASVGRAGRARIGRSPVARSANRPSVGRSVGRSVGWPVGRSRVRLRLRVCVCARVCREMLSVERHTATSRRSDLFSPFGEPLRGDQHCMWGIGGYAAEALHASILFSIYCTSPMPGGCLTDSRRIPSPVCLRRGRVCP